MDLEEEDTPRHILQRILDTEPHRSPVTRSTSAEAQQSHSSARQSARLRSAAGGPQSPRSGARKSSRNNASILNPQEALKRKLRESTAARISLPVGNRRTTSLVTRKSTRLSALQDEDVTPRHILKNILRTEPEVSPVFQKKAVGKKPVLPEATSSTGSDRSSPRLSDLEFSSVTMAAGDQSVRLKRKRSPRMVDVTAFEKRLQGHSEPPQSAARKETAMGSTSPSSGLSDLELSSVTMATTGQSVRGLRRRRSQRFLNVTAFEQRLTQDIDRPATESSSSLSPSTTLSGVTLSLKTPYMDARTEKKALQRKAQHRHLSVEAFEEAVYKKLRVDGATGEVCSKAASSEDFTLNLSNAGPEYTTDLFDHATALYAQPSVLGSTIPITATQDKATVLASQIQREQIEDEQMEVESHTEDEEDAAAVSQSDKAESQTVDEAVEEQPKENEPVESQSEEDIALSQTDEEAHESQTHEVPPNSQLEEETPEEELDSQTDEENPESQPEEEAGSQSEENAEEPESQTNEENLESQPEEEAESQSEEDDEEAHESQTHEVDPETHEVDPDSQMEETPEKEPKSQMDDEENAESQSEEEAESQPEEDPAVSQTDEDVPEYQMEEEPVPESRSEEEDNGKPEAALEETPTKLPHVAEKIGHRAFRSEGGGLVPVAGDGGRDYRSMGAVPMKATETEWTADASEGEGLSEGRSGHVSGTSAQAGADQEDHEDQQEWEDEENETEEPSMKTPAFIRSIRRGVVTKPVPAVLKDLQLGVEDAVSVQPKKRTAKTGGQEKKEPPTIFTKSWCIGTFKHFAKTKVASDVYPVLKEVSEKFFDRMVEDLETYAHHAGRKTIEVEDVILLLKRQGHVTDKVPVEVLIEKYLDMSARKQLIPCAFSGNVVFPKSLP